MGYTGKIPAKVPLTSDDIVDGSISNADLAGSITSAKITSLDATKLTGTVVDARISALTASKLTGALPAVSGASLTALNATNLGSGTTSVARGGTGAATHTANNVLVGNGTSAIASVAPSTSGNVLTSNGSAWASTAAAAGGKVLQIYTLINTTGYSTSSVFGNGTTLPTISDGTSLFDAAAFTPTSGSSKILVEAYIATSGTSGGHATVWMCKDSISNAVSVSACHSQSDYVQLLKLTYEESASNTNARTFKLRYSNNYGGRTTVINKQMSANHNWGGVHSTIQITEYAT